MYLAYWLIAWALGRLDPVDRDRLRHGFGWWSPAMLPHWARVRSNLLKFYRLSNMYDLPHSIENLSTEWTRLDAQRAQKYYRSVIHLLIVALVVANL